MLQFNGTERVLVCPLGWGLGHSTRVIPIIDSLLQKGCAVIVAADKTSIDLLQQRFPNIEFIHFPSINIRLSKGNNQLFALLKIGFKVISLTRKENQLVKRIIEEKRVDVIISDNRYGLYSNQIPSVIITHQLNIIFPKPFKWAMPIGAWYVKRYAERFAECWIPDNLKGFRISGALSQPKAMPKNAEFIGLLSRLKPLEVLRDEVQWDLLGIVSGPPPHREILENEIVSLSNRLGIKTLVVQGLPKEKHCSIEVGNAKLTPHLADEEMAKAILSARYIICRSGYSTIMDLITLNRTALLVPTPGQTEQEYLASYLSEKKFFSSCNQARIQNIDIPRLKEIENNFSTIPR